MVEAVGDFGVGAVGFFALKKLESFLLLPPQTLHRSWEKNILSKGVICMDVQCDMTGYSVNVAFIVICEDNT